MPKDLLAGTDSGGSSRGGGRGKDLLAGPTGSTKKKKKKSGGIGGFFGDVGGILGNAGGELAAIGPGFYGIGRAAFLDVKNNPLSLVSGPFAPLTAQAWARGDTHLYRDVVKPGGLGYAHTYGPLFAHGDLGETLHRMGEAPISSLSDVLLPFTAGTSIGVKAGLMASAPRSVMLRGAGKLAGDKLPKTATGQTRKGKAQIKVPVTGSELSRRLKVYRHRALNNLPPEWKVLGRLSEPDRAAKAVNRFQNRERRKHTIVSVIQERLWNKMTDEERSAVTYKNELRTMENLEMLRDRMRSINPTGPELKVLTNPEVLKHFDKPTKLMKEYLHQARRATEAGEEISGVVDLQRPWATILAARGYSYMSPKNTQGIMHARAYRDEIENKLKAAEEQYSKHNFNTADQRQINKLGGKVWDMEDADLALSQGHYPNGFPYPIRGLQGEVVMPNGRTIYPKGYKKVERLRSSLVTAKNKVETTEKNFATKQGIDVEQVRERFTPGYYKRNPLRTITVYHGTGTAFEELQPRGHGVWGKGIYTTSDPAVAGEYAARRGIEDAPVGGEGAPQIWKMHVDDSKLFNRNMYGKELDEVRKRIEAVLDPKLLTDMKKQRWGKLTSGDIHTTWARSAHGRDLYDNLTFLFHNRVREGKSIPGGGDDIFAAANRVLEEAGYQGIRNENVVMVFEKRSLHPDEGMVGNLVSADAEIARMQREFRATGEDDPFYSPHATVAETQGTRGGGGRSPKTSAYPTNPNRLLLKLMGYAASNIDLLTPEFLRKVAWATAKDTNADLQAMATRTPKGYRLKENEEYVRGTVSEKISYMEKNRAEYERERGMGPEELATDPEYQALVQQERYGLVTDEEIGLQGIREDLVTKDSSAAAVVGDGERLVIKTRVADRIINEYTKSHKALDMFYNKPTLVWRMLVLNLRIGWLVNNLVGNGLLFVVANAGDEGLNALRRLEGLKGGISDEMTGKIWSEQTTTFMGSQAPKIATTSENRALRGAVAILRGAATPARALRAVDVMWEKKLRRRMLTNQLKKNPTFRKIYEDMEGQTARFDAAAERFAKFNPDEVDLISKEVMDAMGNFFDLGSFERKALRGIFPFYAWYKAIVGVTLRMPIDHPMRVFVLAHVGAIGQEIQADDYGLTYLQGRISLPGGYALGTKAMMPYNTLTDLGLATSAGLKAPFGISPSRDAALAASGMFNPFLAIPGAFSQGTLGIPASRYGLAGNIRGLPEVRLAFPRESDLYAGNKYWRELFGYTGFPVKKVIPREAEERGSRVAYLKHLKALQQAKKDLAARTQEVPMGSNSGPRVREMQRHTWLGGTGWPWCVAACICWAEEAGFKLPYQGAGVYAFLDWARKAGWAVPVTRARPGDFVCFNIGAGHMGMLESVVGTTVTTIDGNSSNRVRRATRSLSLVRGFVHLPEKHTVKPVKPPLYEVVTSESGHKMIYASNARRVAKKLPQILEKHPIGVTIRRKKKKP